MPYAGGGQVKVEGLANLKRSMRAAGVDLADLKQATSEVARIVQAAAPHRTGNLAGSITANNAMNRAVVGSRLVYAGPIHWGWESRNIAANPFVTEAAKATEDIWLAVWLTAVDQILADVKGA